MKRFLFLLLFMSLNAPAIVPDSGFYIDIGAGDALTNYYSSSGNSFILRLDGGYDFTQFIGLQVGTENLYSGRMSNYNINGGTLDLSVLPNLPLNPYLPLNLFLRLGAGLDVISSSIGEMTNIVDVFGAGVRYDLSHQVGLTGQWLTRGNLVKVAPANYIQNDFIVNMGYYF